MAKKIRIGLSVETRDAEKEHKGKDEFQITVNAEEGVQYCGTCNTFYKKSCQCP